MPYVLRRGRWPAILGLVLLAAGTLTADPPKVEVQVVKYDELTKKISDQKGKVVVVDFWADT